MMAGFRFPFLSASPRVLRALGPVTAAIALLAVLPQAWSTTFTVANTTFPSTPVGTPTLRDVLLTVNNAVPITKISIASSFTEYSLGAITGPGCVVDPTGNTVVAAGVVCHLAVTYTSALPGTATAPPPISRSAPLLVNDIEGGKPSGYSFALTGSATGSAFAFAPGYLTAFVGNASFIGGFTPGCPGQTDANGDGCPATDAFIYPSDMALDAAGNLYISDGPLNVVHKVDATTGIISIFAGQFKTQGTGGSGGPATSIKLFNPDAIAVDQAGNVFIDDPVQGIWEVNPATNIATLIAGGGEFSIAEAIAQGKTANQAFFGDIYNALLVDPAGNIYFAVYDTGAVYRIDAVTDLLSIYAGSGGTSVFPATGIPGPATSAKLGNILALAMDAGGNLYMADATNGLVLEEDSEGNLAAVVGKQLPGRFGADCTNDSGEWGPADAAVVTQPEALAFDAAGNLYIGEPGSQGGTSCPVYQVNKTTGLIHVVAGDTTGTYGFLNNVGATDTYLSPNLISVDGGGNIYVGQQEISGGVSKILGSQSAIIFPIQSQQVTGTQLVTASNVGIGTNLDFSNYPFPIELIGGPSPSPFSNIPELGNTPVDCSEGTVPAGGICGIQVAYNPTSPAHVEASETLADNSLGVAGTNNVLDIQGSAYNGPTVTLTPPLDFGMQAVGSPTAAKIAQLSFVLSADAFLDSIGIGGPDASSFELTVGANDCSSGLVLAGEGGACNNYVVFNPQASGPLSATLIVAYSAKGVLYTVPDALTGTGIAPSPAVGFTPISLGFGGQIVGSASPALPITLFNSGNAPLIGILPNITGANPGSYAITTGPASCGPTLPASGTCNIYINFAPTAAGPLPATLSIADNAPGSPQTVPLTGTGVVFSSNVGTAEAPQSLTVYITTAGTLNSINVLTQGIANKDFTLAPGGTCAIGTAYTAGQSCTEDIDFLPSFAGLTDGGIQLRTASGAVLSKNFLPGTGNGPQIAFQSGSISTLSSNVESGGFRGVAVDRSGNIFIASTNDLTEIPAGCSTTACFIGIGGGNLSNLTGMAVDGGGNLYVTNQNPTLVMELPLGCTSSSCSITLGGGFQAPDGVAVDGDGNVYVADAYNNAVKEMPPGCLTSSCVTTLGGGFFVTEGVAVDGKGNVYVTDNNLQVNDGGSVKEMPPGCLSSSCVTTLATGLPSLGGLAVDAAGDVYFSQVVPDAAGVYEMLAVGGSIPPSPTILPLITPYVGTGVALDGPGNVYYGAGDSLVKLDTVDPPAQVFPTPTLVGTADDSDDPMTTMVQNIGNKSLTFTGIAASLNFTVDADSTTCSTSSTLAEGATCVLGANFLPTASGTLAGTLTLTDNSLNAAGAMQPISLSGNGMAPVTPTASLSLSALNFGGVQIDTTSPPLIETVTNSGGGTLSISGVTITQTGDIVFVIGTGANQCTNTTALAAGKSCNVYITFKPALSGQTSNGTLNIADNAPPSPQTATLTGVGDYFYEPIGTTSGSEPVSVFITTAGTLSGINVVTEGSSHLDFGNGSGGTCSAGTVYAVGQVCTVNVVFTPRYSGARNGSVYLTDAGGNVLGSTFLAGWGDGPELVFTPATPAAITGTIAGVNSVAVDGAGNLYYVDGSGNVSMLAWTGASYNPATVIVNISSALGAQPANCIAIDANGNLYVGANSRLEKIPATGPGRWGTPIALTVPGGDNVFQIGVDGAGNLYFSDPIHEKVDEMTWNGSQYGAPTAVPFAPSNTVIPWGLAVDSTGDVFTLGTVVASGATEVLELPVNGSGYGSVVTVPLPTIAGPLYLALDGDDNLYVTGLGVSATGDVLLVPYTNNAYGTPISINPGTSFGYLQLTVDGAGNVYAVNQPTSTQFEDEIVKFSLPTPAVLTFNLTDMGSTSSDSPRTVSVTNIGNEDVYFNSVSYPGDFPEDGSVSQQCNDEFPLNAGATCGVSIDFMPTRGGYITEYVTLKDNDLDGDGASQSISVSGTGTEAGAPAVSFNPPSLNFDLPTGNTSNLAVSTLTNTGTAPLTITRTSLTGANPGSFIETDNCVAKSPIPINGTCSISVQFVATVVGPFSAAVSFADNAGNSPQSLPLTATATAGAPIVTLAPPLLAFPVTPVGQVNQLSATLSNTGNAPLTNIGVTITGANSYMFHILSSGSCFGKITLQSDSSCIITVEFSPNGAGSFAATLAVTDNAGNSPQTSALTGTATEAELQFTPGQFNFVAGTPGMVGDTGSGPAINALISGGYGVAIDSTGLVYFSDYDFNTVYQIDDNGNINVYAGMPVEAPGHGSYSGDNGAAASATLDAPQQIAFDPSGNLYIADRFNNLIRMVNSEGTITTFAGNYGNGFGGYAGDGGPANQATLSNPQGVTADAQGNVYIADTNNNVVRKVDTTGTITLFAGTPGVSGNSGDGGPATSATLGQIYQLATDLNGNLYIADFGNGVVRKVDSNGTITTYAGGGSGTVTTTPQPATSVNLNNGPEGLATDPAGNLYVLGLGHTNLPGVFLVNTSQQISQIVGGGATLVNGAPANAENTNLDAIAVDALGDLYVNDAFDHVVSEIDPNGDLAFPNTPVNTASAPLTVTLSNTGNAPLSFTNQNEDVVRKQRHTAPATARALAKGARPDVVDFNSYGNISGPFTIAAGGTCNFDDGIAAGDSCTMNVTFNPIATGPATGTINLYINQAGSSNVQSQVLLTGTGTQAVNLSATLTPTLPFPNTFVASTTSALAATLSNTGNGPLTITSIAIGGADPSDFAISTGSNACGSTLAVGATCSIYVTFTPASAAALSATLTVTDNASPATQSSALTGTGLALMPQVINFTRPISPVTYAPGMTIPLVATGGASGNPVVFTIDAASTGAGTISGSTLTVTGSGSLVIDANQAGNASYSAAPLVQRTAVVNPAPQVINFTQPSTPVTYAPSLTVTLTATGGASGNAVVFTIDASSTGTATVSGSTLTITGVGKIVIDANQAGNANYSAASQVQRSMVVNQAAQAINFTQPATPVILSSGLTITLTATGGASGNAIVFTLDETSTAAGSISGNILTVTSAGNLVIDANQAGSTDYSAAPQVQRTVLVNPPPPDFTISATPPSQTIAPGASTTFTVTLSAINGTFNNVITLSASGLPTGASSSFEPGTINPGNSKGTSTLTVQLPPAQQASAHGSSWPLATPALALLFLLPFRRWRKAWRGKLLLLVAGLVSLASIVNLTGCGGGFLLGGLSQTYTITITGTSGADAHSTTVQLTVK